MRFQATITCKTSSIAVDMACIKSWQNAWYGFIPVAKGSICVDEEDLAETINKLAILLS
jgi:cyanophycin synthetase